MGRVTGRLLRTFDSKVMKKSADKVAFFPDSHRLVDNGRAVVVLAMAVSIRVPSRSPRILEILAIRNSGGLAILLALGLAFEAAVGRLHEATARLPGTGQRRFDRAGPVGRSQ
jgi:hypothetical protein